LAATSFQFKLFKSYGLVNGYVYQYTPFPLYQKITGSSYGLLQMTLEIIVVKGEIAQAEQFLLLPQ